MYVWNALERIKHVCVAESINIHMKFLTSVLITACIDYLTYRKVK